MVAAMDIDTSGKVEVDVAVVLSVTTGILYCDFTAVRDFLAWCGGSPVTDFGAVSLREPVTAMLADLHPWTVDIDPPRPADRSDWLDSYRVIYGDTCLVPTLADYHVSVRDRPIRFVVEMTAADARALNRELRSVAATAVTVLDMIARLIHKEAGGIEGVAVEYLNGDTLRREQSARGLRSGAVLRSGRGRIVKL